MYDYLRLFFERNKSMKRVYYLFLALAVMCLGLLSRRMTVYIPDIIDLFLGDLLWAMMIYFMIRMIFINLTIRKVAFFGILFCFLIETSQLYHSGWIDAIRGTTLGGLILGYGFLWSDLVAYLFGVSFGAVFDGLMTGDIRY